MMNLGLGDSIWAALSEMEEEFDTKPFYQSVWDFYVASLNKVLKKFPFGDTILKDLGIINPALTTLLLLRHLQSVFHN